MPQFNHSLRVREGETEFKTEKLQIILAKPQTLDQLFQEEIQQLQFYKNIKSRHSNSPGEIAFFTKIKSVANPSIISFFKNTFYLVASTFNLNKANALATYLQINKDQDEKRIRQVVIDSCSMSDDVLAEILRGIILQVEEKDQTKYSLNQFTYCNNKFGKQSMALLTKLLPQIYDLKFSNISDSLRGISDTLLNSLLTQITSNSKFLMRITLQNFSLSKPGINDKIQKIFQSSRYLQFVDLSNAFLKPDELANLAKSLLIIAEHIRELNLSYNKLNFLVKDSQEFLHSQTFIKNINILFKNLKIINHVNFSGMQFDNYHLIQVCEILQGCSLIQSIHLNDNKINSNKFFLEEVLSIFNMSQNDVPSLRRSQEQLKTINDGEQSKFSHQYFANKKKEQLEKEVQIYLQSDEDEEENISSHSIDSFSDEKSEKSTSSEQVQNNSEVQNQDLSLKQLKTQINIQKLKSVKQSNEENQYKLVLEKKLFGKYLELKIRTYINLKDQALRHDNSNQKLQGEEGRRLLRNNLVFDQQFKQMQYLKRLVKSKVGEGIGKIQDSQMDQFVLTRVRNHAELIFNQRPQIDSIQRTRFFDMDSSAAWRLSLHSECFMCQRHQYVCIFYERSAVALNTGLIEIRDEQMLAHLKYEYNKEYLLYRTDTPIIRGTVVNRLQSQGRFERPLKMMSTALYTLLSICQSKDFSDNQEQIKNIKQGVLDSLQTDNKQFFENLGIKEKLHGWKHILNDLIHHCELVDVLSINKPDLLQKDIEKKEWYTFGGFFKPGYHQILIYDPKLEKAFCQSFLTNVNQRDFFYPEYPNPIGMQLSKMVPNMWSQWFEDDHAKLEHVFQLCIQSEDFAIEKYIKNQNDIHECLQILGNWMADLVTYQKIMLTVSNRFPRISFEAAAVIIEQIQESKIFQKEFSIIQKAQTELCFIRANRNSGIKGMQSAMRRQELFDFIMRMATAFIQQNFGPKSQICDSLLVFIQKYILPLTQNSKIHKDRLIIRESKRLNELLFDNNKCLIDLFEQAKRFEQEYLPHPLFTLRCAEEFFRYIQQEGLGINYRMISQNFIYSQMTITDENKNFKKYEYLDFVEFQEMICRISLEIFPDEEGIENSVYKILELFWKSQYDRGLWKQDYMPLHPIVNPILQ